MNYLSIILFLIITSICFSQSEKDTVVAGKMGITLRDSIEASKIGWMAYPYAFYTPETQLAFGAGSIVYFKTSPLKSLQTSKVLISGYYTTNDQFYIKLAPKLYFAGKENLTLETDFIYARELMKYYGRGPNSPERSNPDYKHYYFKIKGEVIAQNIIAENIYTGINFEYSTNQIYDFPQSFTENEFTYTIGNEGGVVSGLGTTFLWDNRNSIFYPTKNGFYKIVAQFFGSYLGSDFDYNKYVFDMRQFYEIIPTHILALQLYFEGTTGDTPFFELPAIGGDKQMRGYFYGRYRDHRYLTIQAEYRHIVWWRLGFVVFGGIGNVGSKLLDMKFDDSKYNYGFGLRFVVDEKELINLRADFGFGESTSGVYFGFEEAF